MDLTVRTQSDAGGAITLTSSQNSVPHNVTLSALNTAGNAPASGAIDFVDSTGFTVAAQPGNGLNGQEIGVNTTSDINLVTLNNASNLVLGGKLSAPGHMVTLTSAGTITEQPGGTITAGTLTGSSAGNASFDQANLLANLGLFTTTANGSFTLTDNQALRVSGPLNAAGDVLIQNNNFAQPLTLAGNITAGGRVILDTAGAFAQTGTATVTAPILAIDTTGSGVNTLLGFITSPSVTAGVVSNLPPAGKTSNPIQFGNLMAPNSVVLLFADKGSVSGPIQAGQLGLSGTGSLADLQGSINGVSGPMAALLGVRAPGPDPRYLFNDCILAATTCVVVPPNQPLAFLVTQPQTASEIQELSVSPNLSAQFVLIEPEIVKGVRQSEDPDAPVINIFDEERLCDETAKSQPTKEPCREER